MKKKIRKLIEYGILNRNCIVIQDKMVTWQDSVMLFCVRFVFQC